MSKEFSKDERKILNILKAKEDFKYKNKIYKVDCVAKPKSSKGEPKTDIFFKAVNINNANDILVRKISFKKENHDFLENKISANRAEEIFGKDWSDIIKTSIKIVKKHFYDKKLIFKEASKHTEKGSFTLGWKFEILNKESGALSGPLTLDEAQLLDIYAGTNLDDDKRNAYVDGKRIKDSGIATHILVGDDYNNTNDILDNLIPIESYVKDQNGLYFACKALNYRSFTDSHDGNRPLGVYVQWSVADGILTGKVVLDEPLEHGGNEIKDKLLECLKALNISNTDDITDDNVDSSIVLK